MGAHLRGHGRAIGRPGAPFKNTPERHDHAIHFQPDGWGQLVFNLLGVVVVGAALERRTSRSCWALTYLLGGVGSIVVISTWHPTDLGGGSSDAVAALIGALTVLLTAENHDHRDHHDRPGSPPWTGWPAHLYAVFFAAYLTALDLGGVWWSILAGNATIAVFVVARRALSPTDLTQACLLLVGAAGITMTAQHEGHGIGIITGATIASLVLLRHRILTTARSIDQCTGAGLVVALAVLVTDTAANGWANNVLDTAPGVTLGRVGTSRPAIGRVVRLDDQSRSGRHRGSGRTGRDPTGPSPARGPQPGATVGRPRRGKVATSRAADLLRQRRSGPGADCV